MTAATPLRTRLGRRIRNLRLLKDWSQEKLGAEAGLSYKFVGEVERGVANPSVGTLEALCEALEVDVTELFGKPPSPSPLIEYVPTRHESQVAREALHSLEGFVRRFAEPAGEPKEARYPRPKRSRRRSKAAAGQ